MRAAALAVLILSAAAARAADDTSCVDVTIENQRFYDCLNQRLARAIPDHRALPQPTYGVTAPANELGAYDQAANRERLGSNYGKSVYPARPPPPVFSSPLTRTR